MKKKLLMLLSLTCTLLGHAQSSYFDFTAQNDDGVTVYYKITDETNREVKLGQNNTGDAYKTVKRLTIPDEVEHGGKTYTVVDVGTSLVWNNDMEELNLPSKLKRLDGWQLFSGLKVKKLTLPTSCESFQAYIFHILPLLEEVYLLRETPPISTINFQAFGMLDPNVFKAAYVPVDCSSAYKTDNNWKVDPYDSHYINFPIPYREQLTIGTTGYTSYYLDTENFKVPAGCTAYIITGTKTGSTSYPEAKLTAVPAGSIIPKQTGFILEGTQGRIAYEAAVTGTEITVTDNMMIGTRTDQEFSGAGYKYYVLANGPQGIGFYHQGTRDGESIKLKAHQAGLRLPTSGPAPAKALILDFEEAKRNIITSIKTVETNSAEQQKEIIYDMQGRRVTNPTRGIYIVNGKKQIIK